VRIKNVDLFVYSKQSIVCLPTFGTFLYEIKTKNPVQNIDNKK